MEADLGGDPRQRHRRPKIGDLEFPDCPKEDRTMIIDAMTSLKDILNGAIPRAVENQKTRHENDRSHRWSLNENV